MFLSNPLCVPAGEGHRACPVLIWKVSERMCERPLEHLDRSHRTRCLRSLWFRCEMETGSLLAVRHIIVGFSVSTDHARLLQC